MALQLSTGSLYTLMVAVPCIAALGLGKAIFLPTTSVRSIIHEFIRTDWKYLGVAWTITYIVNTLAMHFHSPQTFTSTIYDIEGATVMMFQAITTTPLTVLFTGIYLVGFPFVVLFTYFKVKAHDEQEAYRYAFAYIALVLLAVPFFIFFPVKITSLYLSRVEPLMYNLSPVIQYGVYSTDTLVKAFPSLHVGLSVLAALYARNTEPAYAAVAWILAVGIFVSTLYLGIHWLTDVAVGLILVVFAYAISQRIRDPENFFSTIAYQIRSRRESLR